jgi:hypothetical protein
MKSHCLARRMSLALAYAALGMCLVLAMPAIAGASGGTATGVSCADVHKRHIDRQLNLRAGQIMRGCGLGQGRPSIGRSSGNNAGPHATAPEGGLSPVRGGNSSDLDVITGSEVYPHATQSETMFARNDNIVVVGYNDSADSAASPQNYSGISRSTDGGYTFVRLRPSPFASGHGVTYGDPLMVYDRKLGVFIATWLASGCGGQGLGTWTSADGLTWSAAACAHNGSGDDRASMWVDNNPGSSYYGRIYVSYNDFNVNSGALKITHSDDASTWSTPVTVNASFIRDVQLTGSPDSDGRVYLMTMDEGGGGYNTRQNILYYSTDGGGTWTSVTMGARFAAAGDTTCSYFVAQHPIWRDMGWGQPAAGPNGLVAYDYTVHGAGSDTGDVYFTRSTDYGVTWSTPIRLNTDSGSAGQWQPSLVITSSGQIVASWYDRRNSTDGSNYEVFYRYSDDGGVAWQVDTPLSSQLIPQPLQPDPGVLSCYAGDYNNAFAYSDGFEETVHMGWTDGRVLISGNSQQDVFVRRLSSPFGLPLLYNQYDNLDVNNLMGIAVLSQDFTTQNQYDTQGADDFVIPSGQVWNIARVDAAGLLYGSTPGTFNVFLYKDAGGVPGTQIFAQTGIIPVNGVPADGSLGSAVMLPLSGVGWLPAGHYWISVQAANKDDFGWYFYLRTIVSNAAGMWQNPSNAFGTGCVTWSETNSCVGTSYTSDWGFQLRGYRVPSRE